MKKVLSLVLLFILMVSIPSFSNAQTKRQEDIPSGSYIIGTYLFNKEKTTNYNGTLTTPMIMLASKSINSKNLSDMIIYYKNSRGKWINAINNQAITNVPANFEITCTNLDCQSNFLPNGESFDSYQSGSIGSGSYVIGTYLFNKEKTTNYNGTLTTPMIMLASKSINSNNLSDMIIYYKNSRGKWINAINNQAITNIPNIFNISYINLVKSKMEDEINVTSTTYNYDGLEKTATVSIESNLIPIITYYSDSTCSSEVSEVVDAGDYYIKVMTLGNNNYYSASLACTKAITIEKVDAICPTIFDFEGNYDKSAHSIFVSGGLGGTIQYQTDGDWLSELPTRINAGITTVSVRILGDKNHNSKECGSKSIKVNKIADYVSVLKGTYLYDGTVKTPTMNVISGLTLNTIYYSDSTCSTMTDTTNALEEGGAPFAVGTYYMIAYTNGNENYNPYSVACREVLEITADKSDDEIFIFKNEATYTGAPIISYSGSKSGLDINETYYIDSTCTTKTPATDTLEAGHAPIEVGDYYVIVSTEGSVDYNPVTSSCELGVSISPRVVTVTEPTIVADDLTYNGNNQALITSPGSCSSGGTMYWYSLNPSKDNNTPSFALDANWSTEEPTYTATDAGTYNIWYYCYVADTSNNTGTGINEVRKVTKEILE